jgi:hypothetical protein
MKLRFNLMISICLLALLTGCREMPPIEWAENPPPNAQIFSGAEMKTGDTWVYKYTAMDIQDVQVKAGIFQAMHVFYTHQSVDSGRSWEREFCTARRSGRWCCRITRIGAMS